VGLGSGLGSHGWRPHRRVMLSSPTKTDQSAENKISERFVRPAKLLILRCLPSTNSQTSDDNLHTLGTGERGCYNWPKSARSGARPIHLGNAGLHVNDC